MRRRCVESYLRAYPMRTFVAARLEPAKHTADEMLDSAHYAVTKGCCYRRKDRRTNAPPPSYATRSGQSGSVYEFRDRYSSV